MAWQVFFTGFALLAVLACAYWAYEARAAAQKAEHSEHRLAIMRGQVRGMEVSLEALDARFKSLAGRVYADEYWRGKDDAQPELQPVGVEAPECPNWAIAQREGPQSEAAKCEDSYCAARRADRAARRAKLRAGVKS